MATPTSIPSDLTDADKAIISHFLDAVLNSTILYSFLNGIIAVTLGNIFINKSPHIKRIMIIVITSLYLVTIINLTISWSNIRAIFISNGQNIWTNYLFFYWSPGNGVISDSQAALDISAILCSALADSIMVTMTQLDSFIIAYYYTNCRFGAVGDSGDSVGYLFFFLFFFLFLQLAACKAGGSLRAYRHTIELLVLIESSALYSISLILYMVAWVYSDLSVYYFDFLAGIARGIASTLFVLRIAGGLIQPDNSCNESTVSSLHFGTHSACQSEITSQQDSMMSVIINGDLETQQRIDGEHGHYVMTGLQDTTTRETPLDKNLELYS
ncbi:hypothetical protein EDD85DRAFT_796452 [Armillaria nabsnona]|nr:hypothetical protein EDD85DRAFT_796452 [Armillaria nabsnona]